MSNEPCRFVLGVEKVVADRSGDDALPVLLHEDVPAQKQVLRVNVPLQSSAAVIYNHKFRLIE